MVKWLIQRRLAAKQFICKPNRLHTACKPLSTYFKQLIKDQADMCDSPLTSMVQVATSYIYLVTMPKAQQTIEKTH